MSASPARPTSDDDAEDLGVEDQLTVHESLRLVTEHALGVLREVDREDHPAVGLDESPEAALVDPAEADEALLGQSLFDEIHVPYRRHLFRGLSETLRAAVDAGAAGATICGHGPSMLALCTDEDRTDKIAKAMVDSLSQFELTATTLALQTAHYGALPLQQPS